MEMTDDEEEHPSCDDVWNDWGDSDIGIVRPPADDDFDYLPSSFDEPGEDTGEDDQFGAKNHDPAPVDDSVDPQQQRSENLTNFFNLNLF